MVLIYRLTSSSGMTGLRPHAGHFTGQSNSTSKNSNPSVPVYRPGMGRLGGVQAFVTSHQTIDDEKGTYGPRSLTKSTCDHNDKSGINFDTFSSAPFPHLLHNNPTPKFGDKQKYKKDDFDNDSVSEVDLKAPENANVGTHAIAR